MPKIYETSNGKAIRLSSSQFAGGIVPPFGNHAAPLHMTALVFFHKNFQSQINQPILHTILGLDALNFQAKSS